MKRRIYYVLMIGVGICMVGAIVLFFLARKETPSAILYGMSFNVPYARELGLNPDATLDALITELGITHFRFAAHWTLIEPNRNSYDFAWMDRSLKAVEEAHGEVIFAVGRRLPRWPECHVPGWADALSWEEQKQEIREYITDVVNRYKDSPVITHWQLENEPFLSVFAHEHCGDLDRDFLEEELSLIRSLDPTRPILVTDSGNLGTWGNAYKLGDAFGTSVYVYFWNPELGKFKTVLPPWWYRAKERVASLMYGAKPTMLIELSLEPWLVEPVTEVPISEQYTRMNPEIFNEIIAYARDTRYHMQYLWGGEWWYWLRLHGDDTMWNTAKQLLREEAL